MIVLTFITDETISISNTGNIKMNGSLRSGAGEALEAQKPLLSIDEILRQLQFIRHRKQEYFLCLSMNSEQRLITRRTVTIGLLDTTLVHPREVFTGALKDRAAAIIVAHNHPSGLAAPSKEDIKTTQQLVAAGLLLGVPVVDHLIITASGHFSFRLDGLI